MLADFRENFTSPQDRNSILCYLLCRNIFDCMIIFKCNINAIRKTLSIKKIFLKLEEIKLINFTRDLYFDDINYYFL